MPPGSLQADAPRTPRSRTGPAASARASGCGPSGPRASADPSGRRALRGPRPEASCRPLLPLAGRPCPGPARALPRRFRSSAGRPRAPPIGGASAARTSVARPSRGPGPRPPRLLGVYARGFRSARTPPPRQAQPCRATRSRLRGLRGPPAVWLGPRWGGRAAAGSARSEALLSSHGVFAPRVPGAPGRSSGRAWGSGRGGGALSAPAPASERGGRGRPGRRVTGGHAPSRPPAPPLARLPGSRRTGLARAGRGGLALGCIAGLCARGPGLSGPRVKHTTTEDSW